MKNEINRIMRHSYQTTPLFCVYLIGANKYTIPIPMYICTKLKATTFPKRIPLQYYIIYSCLIGQTKNENFIWFFSSSFFYRQSPLMYFFIKKKNYIRIITYTACENIWFYWWWIYGWYKNCIINQMFLQRKNSIFTVIIYFVLYNISTVILYFVSNLIKEM